MADILCKCICNVNEFTKAFNIMLGLHGKMGNVLGIIQDGDKWAGAEGRSLGGQLKDEFAQINKLMGDLASSKKSQFLSESNMYYHMSSRINSVH